jgi:hypothetical protein
MEASWLWRWGDHVYAHLGGASNDFNELEKDMLAVYRSFGNESLVSAFMKRHKYSRAWKSFHPFLSLDAEMLWLRREAFRGASAGPKPMVDGEWSDEEWIKMAAERYGSDAGYQALCTSLEAEQAAKQAVELEEARSEEVAVATDARETPTPPVDLELDKLSIATNELAEVTL